MEWTSVSRLLKSLRLNRTTLDSNDVSKAREEADFATFYLTHNEGESRRKVMQRDSDISRRWRERHGLEAQ
jgi:hypothetical protein